MKLVKYEMAYMFFYSERPGTIAAKKYTDDIPEDVKKRRLKEVVDTQMLHALERNREDIGKRFVVLTEGVSNRSDDHFFGRNSQNKVIVFPKKNHTIGHYAEVIVKDCTAATLIGE